VRTRLKYVIPAGLTALTASVVLGVAWAAPTSVNDAFSSGSARGLPMLLAPTVVVTMLIRKRHLLEGLFAGVGLSVALGLTLGLVNFEKLFFIDRAAFGARGLIIDGVGRAVGVSVFTLLLMGLVGILRASKVLERMSDRLHRRARSVQATEGWIVGVVSAAVLLTTHSVVAILSVGPLVKEIGEKAGIHAYRRANLLDLTVCTYPFLLPYFLPTILASSASATAADFGMRRLSPLEVGMANTYSWALVIFVAIAVGLGFGRQEGK
jgi:Na+/H+ antiporter NhaC